MSVSIVFHVNASLHVECADGETPFTRYLFYLVPLQRPRNLCKKVKELTQRGRERERENKVTEREKNKTLDYLRECVAE